MSRVVVFGGTGFIGSALRAGLGDVVAPPRHEVDLAAGDTVRAFLRPGDVVVNAAGYARATDRSEAGLARLRRENVDAVKVLAQEAERAGARQLIHLSSVAAMGPVEGTAITEALATEPRSPYALSKRDAERALHAFADRLPITMLRPTSVFGEGRPLAILLCRIASLPMVPLPGGGSALVPFTYVGNVAAAVRAAIGHESCFGRTFIVGDAQSYPLREIVTGLARGQRKSPIRVVRVPRGLLRVAAGIERAACGRRGAPILDPTRIDTLTRSVGYSIDAFRRATGYEPPISMEEATMQIGAWYAGRRGDG